MKRLRSLRPSAPGALPARFSRLAEAVALALDGEALDVDSKSLFERNDTSDPRGQLIFLHESLAATAWVGLLAVMAGVAMMNLAWSTQTLVAPATAQK